MAFRARLIPPQPKKDIWPWHSPSFVVKPVSILACEDRRMEAESYLHGGYGTRLSIEAIETGWDTFDNFATAWQPNRLKGILVEKGDGTPFVAATQTLDKRPIPRKWIGVSRTPNVDQLFVKSGDILVTRSGSVGRATLAREIHEEKVISDDLLRINVSDNKAWGWIYAYLRSSKVQSMMRAAKYGQIIKHLEPSHVHSLPVIVLNDNKMAFFSRKAKQILQLRNLAHQKLLAAEDLFQSHIGEIAIQDSGENGFTVKAASHLFSGRRRLDAAFHSSAVREIKTHLKRNGKGFTTLPEAGYTIWLPNRFKRIPAEEGTLLVGSSELFEINPPLKKRIAESNLGDPYNCRVNKGWLLLARSGQIYGLNGSLMLATSALEDKIISDHVIRIAPNDKAKVRPGYVLIALTHPTLGRPLMKALPYGSSIPEIEVADVKALKVVRLRKSDEDSIADLAEESSELFAKADLLENSIAAEADDIIERFTNNDFKEVVG